MPSLRLARFGGLGTHRTPPEGIVYFGFGEASLDFPDDQKSIRQCGLFTNQWQSYVTFL